MAQRATQILKQVERIHAERHARRQRMRQARQEAGLSQAEMAQRLWFYDLTVRHQSIALWEKDGGMDNEFEVLRAWADITGVEFTWLATGEGGKSDQGKRYTHCSTPLAGERVVSIPEPLLAASAH